MAARCIVCRSQEDLYGAVCRSCRAKYQAEGRPTPRWTRADLIPNAPVREAYKRSGLPAVEVCARIGWRSDTSRLHRRLGLMSQLDSKRNGGKSRVQENIDRYMAADICRAIGVDFDELYEGVVFRERPPACFCSCGEPMIWPSTRCGFCIEEQALFGRVAA